MANLLVSVEILVLGLDAFVLTNRRRSTFYLRPPHDETLRHKIKRHLLILRAELFVCMC